MELAKFEGDVYLGRIDPATGAFLGYVGPLECDAFEPGREDGNTLEIKSKRRDIYGQAIFSETEPGSTNLRMVFKEQPSEILAIAFAANPAALAVTGAAVTDEAMTVTKLDTWLPLLHKNVSAVVVNDATPAVIANTNYEVNPRLGMIKFLSTGTVAVDDAVTVDYTYGSLSGEKFDGETVAEASFRVYFDGKNRVSKKDFSMEYYEVKIPAPTSIFDLLSSDLVTLELTGNAITPSGKTAPYQVVKFS